MFKSKLVVGAFQAASLWRLAVVFAIGVLALAAMPARSAQATGNVTAFQIVTPSAPPTLTPDPLTLTTSFTFWAEASGTSNALLSGHVVTWSVTAGCGTVDPSTSSTGTNGRASTVLTVVAGNSAPANGTGCWVHGDTPGGQNGKHSKQQFLIGGGGGSSGGGGGGVVADNTAPAVTCETPPDTIPWYTDDVEVDCTASDGSGLANADDASFTLSTTGEGSALSTGTRIVCDSTAPTPNCTTVGPFGPYKVDKTAPDVTCDAPDNTIWYNVNVSVPCTSTDGGSGLATLGDSSFNLTTTGEGASVSTGSRTVCDVAGNCADAVGPFTYQVDKTAPVVTCTPPSTTPWYTADVTVPCTSTDGGSGVAGGDESFNLTATGEGAAVSTDTRIVCDVAGNCAAPVGPFGPYKVDKTAPVVTVTGVTNGGSYSAGTVPTAGCGTTDALSGVASPATVSVTGGNANGVGTFTVTCSGGTDVAGNTVARTTTASYTVKYVFCGFKQPLLVPVQSYKTGSTIPVKFCIKDGNGQSISTVVATVYANGGLQGLAKYTDPLYHYNLQTKGMAIGPLTIVVKLDDGMEYSAGVNLTLK